MREKAIPQSASAGSDAAEMSSWGQQREQTVWMGGWSPWWSSWLSLYTAWCRCPGGREAQLQQCGWQFARPYAELCGCQRCCFQTRRWCSRSGCSPQCRCRMIWGCWGLFQTSSAVLGRRDADVPPSALHLCELNMWDPPWCESRGTFCFPSC